MSARQTQEPSSTRPYLIRALHEWCSDNGLTPYITVAVDDSVQVPREHVKNGEIVLNIGFSATTALQLGNDYIAFKARFSGVVRDIMLPVEQVLAIFASESGQGMAFPKPEPKAQRLQPVAVQTVAPESGQGEDVPVSARPKPGPISKGGKPALTRVK